MIGAEPEDFNSDWSLYEYPRHGSELSRPEIENDLRCEDYYSNIKNLLLSTDGRILQQHRICDILEAKRKLEKRLEMKRDDLGSTIGSRHSDLQGEASPRNQISSEASRNSDLTSITVAKRSIDNQRNVVIEAQDVISTRNQPTPIPEEDIEAANTSTLARCGHYPDRRRNLSSLINDVWCLHTSLLSSIVISQYTITRHFDLARQKAKLAILLYSINITSAVGYLMFDKAPFPSQGYDDSGQNQQQPQIPPSQLYPNMSVSHIPTQYHRLIPKTQNTHNMASKHHDPLNPRSILLAKTKPHTSKLRHRTFNRQRRNLHGNSFRTARSNSKSYVRDFPRNIVSGDIYTDLGHSVARTRPRGGYSECEWNYPVLSIQEKKEHQ
jgi:hypothetical protein